MEWGKSCSTNYHACIPGARMEANLLVPSDECSSSSEEADMTCDRCTRAPVGACVGESLCASINLSDEEACGLAASICLSWWQKRDEEIEIDDMLWEMSERRIDELLSDPWAARAYLAERVID